MSMLDLEALLRRADHLLERLESILPRPLAAPDWSASVAFRYRRRGASGWLQPVRQLSAIALTDLQEVDGQKERLVRNTAQFVAGLPANNVLLTGARGTGKSSLIKACLNAYAQRGLRLIEVDKADLVDLPDLVDLVAGRTERFIVYCDDLSFDDGSVLATADNVLVYATSNRRHLLPEYMKDNLSYTHTDDGEVHPGEVIEEKISLSERFGLWISFYPFSQDEYLAIVAQWLRHFGVSEQTLASARQPALVWALERGSRSGRVAYQFARDWAGRGESAAGAVVGPATEQAGADVGGAPPEGLDSV
jgi:predicted AAA+ superfamily ATPase